MISLLTAVSVTFFALLAVTLLLFWIVFRKDWIPTIIVSALKYSDNGQDDPIEPAREVSTEISVAINGTDSHTSFRDDLASRARVVTAVSTANVKESISSSDGEIVKSYTVTSTRKSRVTFVHVSQDTIRAYEVKCGDEREVSLVLEAGLDDNFSPKALARNSQVESVAVPTAQMSHVEMHTVQEYNIIKSLWSHGIFLIALLFDYFMKLIPVVIAMCATVIVIITWYVTLSQGNAEKSETLTNIMFAFATLCLVGEVLTLLQAYRRNNRKMVIIHGILSVLSLFCWALAFELLYLANGGNPGQSSEKSSSSGKSSKAYEGPDWGPFRCECDNSGDDDANRRKLMGNNYEWTCPSTTYGDICDTACGVCGNPYYGTFVTFALSIAFYWLCSLFFGFFSVYYEEIRLPKRKFTPTDIQFYAMATLHGSHNYGYPVNMKLNMDEGLALVKIFSRVHLEAVMNKKCPENIHHGVCCGITAPSRPAPGIQSVVYGAGQSISDMGSFVINIFMDVFSVFKAVA